MHSKAALQRMMTLRSFQVLSSHSSLHEVLPEVREVRDGSLRSQ